MKKKTLTARQLREKKFLLRAPLPAIALLTLLFWGLGGGKTRAGGPVAKGFDMGLPAAHVKPIAKLDKMGYYEQAQRDSAIARQKARMEANYARVLGIDSAQTPEAVAHVVQTKLEQVKRVLAGESVNRGGSRPATDPGGFVRSGGQHNDGLGRDIYASDQLDANARRIIPGRPNANAGGTMPFLQPNPNLERLEKTMTALQRDDAGNAELSGLAAVLEKLTNLQAPHETGQHRAEQTVRRPALIVKALPDADDTIRQYGFAQGSDSLRRYGSAQGGDSLRRYGFARASDSLRRFDSTAIEAVVPEEQVLVSGGELKLELTRDILLDNHRIPAGTSLYGIASLSGERLRVTISAIAWQNRVFPVQLQVDDEDGLAGIYIPGAPLTDAARESVASEIGAVGPTVVSTGLAGQAANAGMTLARSLISKKVRPVRVTVPAGYHVLLHPKIDGL